MTMVPTPVAVAPMPVPPMMVFPVPMVAVPSHLFDLRSLEIVLRGKRRLHIIVRYRTRWKSMQSERRSFDARGKRDSASNTTKGDLQKITTFDHDILHPLS